MKNWIIILCLLTPTASAMTLQELADGWGTKYNLTDFGKLAKRWQEVEDFVVRDGQWIEIVGKWLNGEVTGVKRETTIEISILRDGLWISVSKEIDTKSSVKSVTYGLPPVTRQKTSTPKPAPRSVDPNDIEKIILSDPGRYGPLSNWKGLLE